MPAAGASADAIALTVVTCCYNGRARLAPTIAHLMAQRTEGIRWEWVLVDNASTDGTADFARQAWTRGDVEMRVVEERTPGLSVARVAGLGAARGRYVSFVDDDNWLAPDWLAIAFDLMEKRPRVGLCGGYNEGAFEEEKPEWIDPYLPWFAVGPQEDLEGKPREWLCGAGLTIRSAAWKDLTDAGFRFRGLGRTGGALTSGEDLELCFAAGALGWELVYEPRLRLKHFMPRGRLTWEYLRRLARGNGISSVYLDAYKPEEGLRGTWIGRIATTSSLLVRGSRHMVRSLLAQRERNPQELRARYLLGRLEALWKLRNDEAVSRPVELGRRS